MTTDKSYWHLFDENGRAKRDADYHDLCACAADWAQRTHDGEVGWRAGSSYNVRVDLVAARTADNVPYKLDWTTLMSVAEQDHIVDDYIDPMLAEIAKILRASSEKQST